MASRTGSAPSRPRIATAPNPGVPVDSCRPGSPAARAGVRPGDIIIEIDGQRPLDSIDADVMTAEPSFRLTLSRAGRRKRIRIERSEGTAHGLVLAPPPVRTCVNNCSFCYVDQFPARRFRSGLGVYDDDYRHSFLFGNFVTLTNLSRADLDRIIALRLSPLYVSVHATDPEVRARILGRPRVAILPVLRRLAEAGITVHAQIVLVRGVNDGRALRRTLDDLAGLRPAVKTVAIVPVGLTAHHRGGVAPWTAERARRVLPSLRSLTERTPPGFAQLADEWFVLARRDPPPAAHYGDFDVIEDGVGLIRRLLDDWRQVRLPERVPTCSALLITGRSPARFLRRIVARLNRVQGVTIDLGICDNRTFGAPVTVTGLLAWSDIRPVIDRSPHRTVFIPDVLLDRENRFLDEVTLAEARRESGRSIRVLESTAKGLLGVLHY